MEPSETKAFEEKFKNMLKVGMIEQFDLEHFLYNHRSYGNLTTY